MNEQIEELCSLLQLNNRPDVQIAGLHNLLAFSGNKDGLEVICENPKVLKVLVSLLENSNPIVAKDASLILINVSAWAKGSGILLQNIPGTLDIILKYIIDPDSSITDPCCMILSNLTRPHEFTLKIVDELTKTSLNNILDELLNILTKVKYNNKEQKLYYLGPTLSNLSQSPSIRKYILHKDKNVIKKLLPFTTFKDSSIKRGGIVGTLRNCCFETDYHDWLLSDEVDILPALLLPLAGNTEYDEDDNDKLPLDLQYLPEDKTIEEDPDIRCMLLEAITQLCALRCNREYIRSKNAYVILRELHKWEKDGKALLACENLVDILIRTEDEIGEDNLKEIVIPDHVKNEFLKIDDEQLKND